jgi:hypothetical protein|tara:strand:- start:1471 stop:1818 length:348 start_codon:yes stop_codon:yes gene_type:complete
MMKNILLLSIFLVLVNGCATTKGKFNVQKDNCKEIYGYFTKSKDCLGLNFQNYYSEKDKEYEKQHDLILDAISNQVYENRIDNEQAWKNYEDILKQFRSSKDKTGYLTNVLYRLN